MKSLVNYIVDSNFSFKYQNNLLNINNYKDIIILEENKVVVTYSKGRLQIKGNNLHIKKLLDQEILLSGNITSIKLGEANEK